MSKLISLLVLSAALAACGGGSKGATTPSPTPADPGVTGGQTYGKPAPTTDTSDGTQPPMPDPCAAP